MKVDNRIDNIVILAGGESRRFWPLEDKLLFKFLGKELIVHQIERFQKFGKRIFLVVNRKLKKRLEFLKNKVTFVLQPSNDRGQAGALRAVINKINGPVLVVNGNDVFEEEDLLRFFERVANFKSAGHLVFVRVNQYFPGGYLKFNHAGEIIEIVEKPERGKEPSECVRAVLDFFPEAEVLQQALEDVKEFYFDEQYEQAINIVLKKVRFYGFELKKGFLSVKYPWHILKLMRYFLSKAKNSEGKNVSIGKETIIEGPVFLDEGVKIGNFCKLKGPLYIGKNTIVGDFTLLRESHIGSNCLIGSYSEVARSYLAEGVYLHKNYVGDSVFAKNVMLGAGSITANYRLDGNNIKSKVKGKKVDTGFTKLGAILGKGVKIGSGTILLPGVKVGENSFIGPGEIIKKDIEQARFVFQGKNLKNKALKK